jgi:sphinganine-1-phosphate aldolase
MFPEHGTSPDDLFEMMLQAKRDDVDWKRGRLGLFVHYAGDDVLDVAKRAHQLFFSENALGQSAFPSLVRFEQEVVAWALDLFHASPEGTGNITSGGTESIFLALKTARDWAFANGKGGAPASFVVPESAHPAFDKAAHYLGLKIIRVPLREDFTGNPTAMEAAIDEHTIGLAASAPAFPHGVFDAVAETAELASRHGLWCHVDACVGGFLSPFAAENGRSIPPFDFDLLGVTSLSADLHKYGFTAKGASLILFRSSDYRQYQQFSFDAWPRGAYSSPTFAGTRPGGPIAAAWAVIRYLGRDGYRRLAHTILDTTDALKEGVEATGMLHVWGTPQLSVFAYGSNEVDIFAVAQGLTNCGWTVGRLSRPPGVHMGMLTPAHAPYVDEYLSDLHGALEDVKSGKVTTVDRTATYG